MPSEKELPADLKNLVYKQAHPVDYRRDFDRDMDRLLATFRKQKYFQTNRWYVGLLNFLPEAPGRGPVRRVNHHPRRAKRSPNPRLPVRLTPRQP